MAKILAAEPIDSLLQAAERSINPPTTPTRATIGMLVTSICSISDKELVISFNEAAIAIMNTANLSMSGANSLVAFVMIVATAAKPTTATSNPAAITPRAPMFPQSLVESKFSICFNANINTRSAPVKPISDTEVFPMLIFPSIAEIIRNDADNTANMCIALFVSSPYLFTNTTIPANDATKIANEIAKFLIAFDSVSVAYASIAPARLSSTPVTPFEKSIRAFIGVPRNSNASAIFLSVDINATPNVIVSIAPRRFVIASPIALTTVMAIFLNLPRAVPASAKLLRMFSPKDLIVSLSFTNFPSTSIK